MKTLLISIALLLSLSEFAHARTSRSQSQLTYLSEIRAILTAQTVDSGVLDVMEDYLLSVGQTYCLYKEDPRSFHLYDRVLIDDLKRHEEELVGHPRAQALYKFFALTQMVHKAPADRNL